MTEYNRDDPAWSNAARTWGAINAELDALEGKNAPASCQRRLNLWDQIMSPDMAFRPIKKAMAKDGEISREGGVGTQTG